MKIRNWEKGIHSYLAYLRDRLVVARELLTDSGSVFMQIGDENVHLVRVSLPTGVHTLEVDLADGAEISEDLDEVCHG